MQNTDSTASFTTGYFQHKVGATYRYDQLNRITKNRCPSGTSVPQDHSCLNKSPGLRPEFIEQKAQQLPKPHSNLPKKTSHLLLVASPQPPPQPSFHNLPKAHLHINILSNLCTKIPHPQMPNE